MESWDFSQSQWRTLQFAPFWVAQVMAAAVGSKGKRGKTLKQLLREIADAPNYRSPLARAVFLSIAVEIDAVTKHWGRDPRDPLDGLGEVRQIVDSKIPSSEADHFKRTLIFLGRKIGEAGSKGIFSSGKLDKKQLVALALVAAALDVSM